jgi:catechol 2,3-dioxygenase-like lactoylglutathione lyase family enzyme
VTYKVDRLYHPSHRVPDLQFAEQFFEDVFGRTSVLLSAVQAAREEPPFAGYPSDYSFFTLIGEVWFDTIDPKRYVIDGVQRYASIDEPHLSNLAWAVQGIDEIFQKIRERGIRCIDQYNEEADGPNPPTAAFSRSPLFWTRPEDTGLRYEIYPTASIGAGDPRSDPSWVVPPASDDDPLTIVGCSHHTVLTSNVPRALRFLVDVLGGNVVGESENKSLRCHSTQIWLGDTLLEVAVPREGTSYAAADLRQTEPLDVYHSLTWIVKDIDAVHSHLRAQKVRFETSFEGEVIVDPKDGLGIPWVFTTGRLECDPR